MRVISANRWLFLFSFDFIRRNSLEISAQPLSVHKLLSALPNADVAAETVNCAGNCRGKVGWAVGKKCAQFLEIAGKWAAIWAHNFWFSARSSQSHSNIFEEEKSGKCLSRGNCLSSAILWPLKQDQIGNSFTFVAIRSRVSSKLARKCFIFISQNVRFICGAILFSAAHKSLEKECHRTLNL